jgi:hypothetical protein
VRSWLISHADADRRQEGDGVVGGGLLSRPELIDRQVERPDHRAERAPLGLDAVTAAAEGKTSVRMITQYRTLLARCILSQ